MRKALKAGKYLICAAVLGAVTTAGWAGDALDAQKAAQRKLLAYRAARADGMRKLGERIRGLRITSDTYVKDFVTESDQIRTALEAFLAGIREEGKPVYQEDGTCQVTVVVDLATVTVTLEQIYNKYYKGGRFKIEDIQKITVNNDVKTLKEVGQGAPRMEFEEADLVPTTAGEPVRVPSGAMKFWMAHCMPQGRLMAERAARVEGMRRLAERIKGVYITSSTSVKDFVAESDDINVRMDTFLKGAREVGVRYHDNELIVEVEMEVTLRTVYATVKEWGEAHYKGDKLQLQKLQELSVEAKDEKIREVGMGVPPEKYLKDVTPAIKATNALAGNVPDWICKNMRTAGESAVDGSRPEAQAKLMAYRAAELDARRKLSEQINGLYITSSTTVKDFVAQNDEINTSMMAFQQGARVLDETRKVKADGTAEVIVEIELKPLWNSIMTYTRKLSITLK
jgi:hypothetical protein